MLTLLLLCRCIGSTQHLKDKFGGGYHLEVKLQGSSTEDQAAANMETLHTYVDQAFPGSVRMESFGDRAQYRIPHAHITSLSQTFLKLEEGEMMSHHIQNRRTIFFFLAT